MRVVSLIVLFGVFASGVSSTAAASGALADPFLGKELVVTPGDEIYRHIETTMGFVAVLDAPFEGRMPGSMRIPFSFAVDVDRLPFAGRRGHIEHYAAPEGLARAWHGLVGNVLAPGDKVGLRRDSRNGGLEWFVDNSNHNGFRTVWSRKYKPRKDPPVRFEEVEVVPDNARYIRADYLGVRDRQIRIRLEEGDGSRVRSDEFLFPIEEMPMKVALRGLEIEFVSLESSGATLRVLKGAALLRGALPDGLERVRPEDLEASP